MKTLYIALNACWSTTGKPSSKIGDMITMAYAARLFCETEQYDHCVLSMNPGHPLNFVFDKLIEDFRIEVIYDAWPLDDMDFVYEQWDERRKTRMVNGAKFDIYKEFYLRIHGGQRQCALAGAEKGLGHINIFGYYFFGQESSPETCPREADFRPSAFGYQWNPRAPQRSVLISPHAVSQGNEVFTETFWRDVIVLLTQKYKIEVTVNTPTAETFGHHELIRYSFHPNDFRGLFKQVSEQRLSLSGNTGIAWIAAAHGVPVIVGEPAFFWYMCFRMRQCGVPAAYIFDQPDPVNLAERVNWFLSP